MSNANLEIMSERAGDIVIEDRFAMTMMAQYILHHHGPLGIRVTIESPKCVVEPQLADQARDLAERRETNIVVSQITNERADTRFELPGAT